MDRGERMFFTLRDVDIGLWDKVKAKATLERKTMREVIFESLKWYITPVATPLVLIKRRKVKRKVEKKRRGRLRGMVTYLDPYPLP
jgi:hypothetical protein